MRRPRRCSSEQILHERGHQRRALGELVDFDVLTFGVRVVADGAEAVEHLQAEPGEHAAVGAPADGRLGERGQAEPAASSCARAKSAAEELRARAAGSRCFARRRRWWRGRRARGQRRPRRCAPPPGSFGTRTSIRADASAGTVLTAVPAATSVGVTVVPSSGRASAASGEQLVSELDAAFAPFSGSRPACAARPRTLISYSDTPLRSVFSAPSGARLEHERSLDPCRRFLDQRPGGRRPGLLVGREHDRDAVGGSSAASANSS